MTQNIARELESRASRSGYTPRKRFEQIPLPFCDARGTHDALMRHWCAVLCLLVSGHRD